MNTVVMALDEPEPELRNLIRSLRNRGNRVVLTDAGKQLVEIVPIDPNNTRKADVVPGPRTGPRVVYNELTGYPVITARPGARTITSEDVRRMLEDFP
jgi:antitoxin (DNA-binding transcriptional repressor) of toxin-antitoxin stability system